MDEIITPSGGVLLWVNIAFSGKDFCGMVVSSYISLVVSSCLTAVTNLRAPALLLWGLRPPIFHKILLSLEKDEWLWPLVSLVAGR